MPGFQLCEQESRKKVRRKIAGTKVYPSVFVDLATRKLAAVGPLLTNDQRALYESRITHDQGSALTQI
jgi:hypothetical protein